MQRELKQENELQTALFTIDYDDAFLRLRDYLAGRFVGATRDEVLLEEVLTTLFCKIYLTRTDSSSIGANDPAEVASIYRQAFVQLRSILPNIFAERTELLLDNESLHYVDRVLDTLELSSREADPFGAAYQAFMGSGFRGQEGQFFTPKVAVDLLVDLVDPQPEEKIVDPACGTGGFLSAAAKHVSKAGASSDSIASNLYGIDKDEYLSRLASAHLSMFTLLPSNVSCADSLAWSSNGQSSSVDGIELGQFDVVLTNPPFGARIQSASKAVQGSFDLGYKWRQGKDSGDFFRTNDLHPSISPQVLFIERCLSLVRPGGRVGMVVPESLLSSAHYRYVVRYLRGRAHVRAVIGAPENLFKTSGKGGTHTKTCLIIFEKMHEETREDRAQIFMAEAHWCGHDSRGRSIDRNDLPTIANNYRELSAKAESREDHLGYLLTEQNIVEDVLAPRYYDPDVEHELEALSGTHDLVKLGDLVRAGELEIATGDEVGKLAYGTGTIPFVRTSDISNWEVKLDPKHCVSDDIYEGFALKQDVRANDILMVKDGTYLIGTCAFVTKYDTRMIYQSHLYKLRTRETSRLSSHLLLAILSSQPVQKQIKAKRFTQDIIDSLGKRIHELVLPIPKDEDLQTRIGGIVERAINERIEARELARRASLEVTGSPDLRNQDVSWLRSPQV